MKIALSIEHPAWAWQFRRIIQEVETDGKAFVIAVGQDRDTELLDSFNISYELLSNTTGNGTFEKGLLFLKLCIAYTKHIAKFRPDLLIGRASPMMAVAAFLTRTPHLIFEDTEVSRFSLTCCKLFSSRIITPEKFLRDIGKKQIRLPIYKELFYLHRDEFTPDKKTLSLFGINDQETYFVVRFISWNASHDIGKAGISDEKKIQFIQSLNQYAKIYISSEGDLPQELEEYRLKGPYEMIHQVLYHAVIVISEGASMASEAAILGTHAFYLNSIASGITEEQEKKYHLLRVLHDPLTRYDRALEEIKELMTDTDLWTKGKEKRERLLDEMPDPNELYMRHMEELLRQ